MFKFVQYEPPKSRDDAYTWEVSDGTLLKTRREQLGLTQQQVAEKAGIQYSQYQRLEAGERELSGCSMKVGLAICAVLMLDPYEIIGVVVDQPDPETMKPQAIFDAELPDNLFPKKAGRKQIRRDIMTVYFNHYAYSIIIPREVLEAMGKPAYIEIYQKAEEMRFLFRGLNEPSQNAFDVPTELYTKGSALVFPLSDLIAEIKKSLGWDDDLYAVECRAVHDKNNEKLILCDLKTAKESENIPGPYVSPAYFGDDDDE